MRAVMMYGPQDVRVEHRADPVLLAATDAIISVSASCVCGSDLWPYRGTDPITEPAPMGHEYVGVVQQIGSQVERIKVGDFVVGSFFASDNTCEICRAGYQSRCVHAELMGSIGTQAEMARIPLADGTLVATPGRPDDDLIPSLLTASDVLGTGWFAAVAAEAGPGKTVAVVGTVPSVCSPSSPHTNSEPTELLPSAVTRTGRPSPEGSAPQTLSKNGVSWALSPSRNSLAGSGPTASSKRLAPRNQ